MKHSAGSVLRIVLALLLIALPVLAEQRCPACGTSNSDSAQFCKNCGARLEAGRERESGPARLSADAVVSGSSVSITSRPAGADVEIDGVLRGKTPLVVDDLGPGRHDWRVSLAGYRSQTGSFVITVRTGTIVVTTEPVGAQIYLDGKLMGRAGEGGLALSGVSFGRHSIRARYEGYNDVTKTVDLQTTGPYGVTLRLGWGKGFLRVTSVPESARLSIKGQPVGFTPYFGEFAPERYPLALSRRGYVDWLGYAEVYQAETVEVRVALERLRTRKPVFLIAGLVGLAAGGLSAWRGEQSYDRYQAARSADSARHWRAVTERWDWGRNIALGAGAALCVSWVLVRW